MKASAWTGFVLGISVAWVLAAGDALGAETEGSGPAKKTIDRQFDHVVITGAQLQENLGKSISPMRLYASVDGTMRPIPFQIDEITESGDWVLTNKSPYLTDSDAKTVALLQDDPPLVMDENDELAFMIADSGDRAEPSSWPKGWHYADEIELLDAVAGQRSWVYLFSFEGQTPLSPVDYVDYEFPEGKQEDRIHTDLFTLGFSKEVPITWDYMSFQDGVNIIDRMKIRMKMRFFRIFKCSRTENDMNSRLWQYKDGPVRVVRMVRSSIKLVGRLQSPEVKSETLYYRNAVLMPMRVKVPFSPRGIVQEASFKAGADFRDRYGWKVRLNSDDRWLNVDGKMDEVERNVRTEGARWFILKGQEGAMMLTLHYQEDYGLDTEFFYLDDDGETHPPEFYPAQVPYVGYRVKGMENMKRGQTFRVDVVAFYMNQNYTEQQLMTAVNIFDNPIKVAAQRGASLAGPKTTTLASVVQTPDAVD